MANNPGDRMGAAARLFILTVLIGFYGWLHFALVYERDVARALEDRGVLVNAKVLNPDRGNGGFRNHAHLVQYEFVIAGKRYEASEVIWQKSGSKRRSVSIHYDGSDPSISRLSQSDRLYTLFWAAIIFDLLLGIAAIVIWREQRGVVA